MSSQFDKPFFARRSLATDGRLVVIVGETASGKSALGLQLARRFDGEIISADSWAVYKKFDIGTAKPSLAEQAAIPHHLINVAEPADGFSAVLFQKLARQAIDDITGRGKLPIMVGGTGLYVDGVVLDYGFLPPSDPALRAKLNSLSLEQLLERTRTMELDTRGIDVRNKRRVIRLIENNGQRPSRGMLHPNTLILGVRADRGLLAQKIEQRVDAMLAAGLEGEVRRLSVIYGWGTEPMKGVGYAQWRGYFDGQQSLAETRQKIIKATLDLAKRQRTWFKRHDFIQWLDGDDVIAQAERAVSTFIA